MTTRFFRAADESSARVLIGDGMEISRDGWRVSVLGLIPDGGTEPVLDDLGQPMLDEQGQPVTQPTHREGWHFNGEGDIPNEWEQYEVFPGQPMRVFG